MSENGITTGEQLPPQDRPPWADGCPAPIAAEQGPVLASVSLMGNTTLSELYRLQACHPSAYGRRPPQL